MFTIYETLNNNINYHSDSHVHEYLLKKINVLQIEKEDDKKKNTILKI